MRFSLLWLFAAGNAHLTPHFRHIHPSPPPSIHADYATMRILTRIAFIFAPLVIAFVFNEFLVYHVVISGCSWPESHPTTSAVNTTRVMIVADTHLLGKWKGHWFDKMKREWQMLRAFQAAITHLSPEAVFFLGDLFDEGAFSGIKDLETYANQFDYLFSVPKGVKLFMVPGNHDIGHHYEMHPGRVDWFSQRYGMDATVSYVNLGGNHIILINSMALEQDGCRLCEDAELGIKELSKELECSLKPDCNSKLAGAYSRPVVMMHFPLFRPNDLPCNPDDDLMPEPSRSAAYKEAWDCLSNSSTNLILKALKPRAFFGGHSHYSCSRWWSAPWHMWEYTLASFSWRNNFGPSFLLVNLSPSEVNVHKCMMPNEITTFIVYALALIASVIIAAREFCLFRKVRFFPVISQKFD
uniref:Metallophos domain-containing protein n=1 Tax=Panagrellus redivivus TaxID=6233 RepID=A0A7E4V1M6_PANRE